MSSSRINETKEKIINWLKEEGYFPLERANPHTRIYISVRASGWECDIIQYVEHIDKLFVVTNVVLLEEQVGFLRKMTDEKKNAFFCELRMSLLKNNELGNFEIEPNPPQDIRNVGISSRTIFYDDLTKSRLIGAIMTVLRAGLMVVWMLEQFAGVTKPKRDQKSPYSV